MNNRKVHITLLTTSIVMSTVFIIGIFILEFPKNILSFVGYNLMLLAIGILFRDFYIRW